LNGLRIAQISDTHVIYPEDVDQVKAQIEAAKVGKADLLFFTGDLADTTALIPNTVTVFKEAEKDFPLGVWFVLGNHEYFQGLPLFMAEFEKQKVRLLRNEGATLSYQGTSFYLGGVDYPWKGNVFSRDGGGASFDMAAAESDLDRVLSRKPADLYMVLGAHHPGAFDLSFDKKVGLTLSGHTHASQVGFGGRSLNPFVKYNWGLYEKDGFWGYVTSGAGEWFPIRFGAQEEVVIFTLRRTSR
jgi:predicted MPP superfamily phosphohydrolase